MATDWGSLARQIIELIAAFRSGNATPVMVMQLLVAVLQAVIELHKNRDGKIVFADGESQILLASAIDQFYELTGMSDVVTARPLERGTNVALLYLLRWLAKWLAENGMQEFLDFINAFLEREIEG